MKKSTIAVIVAVLLIIAGVCIASVALVMAEFSFEELSGERFERASHAVEDEFEHIYIAAKNYDVAILPIEGGEILIDFDESKNLGIVYELDRDMLVIKARDDRKWFDYIGINTGSSELKVYLPKSAYTSLTVSTDTGDITVPEDLTFTRSSIATSTGNINILAKIEEVLELAASTGHITVSNQELTKLGVSVSTGRIILENIKAEGRITLESSTGRTELHSVEAGGITSKGTTGDLLLKNVYVENDINIKRNTGDVTLTSVVAGAFDIETSTGDVTFLASDAENIRIETGTGKVEGSLLTDKIFITESSTGKIKVPTTTSGGTCKIRTSTGDIEITIE